MAQKTPLVLKDWIAFTFSALALIISSLGFYFSNIRVADRLQARVADAGIRANEGEPIDSAFVLARIAFVNSGNRQAAVLDAGYLLAGDSASSASGGGSEPQDPDAFPMVLNPREMRLVDMRIPVRRILSNFDRGVAVECEVRPAPGPCVALLMGLTYEALDSKGDLHHPRLWFGKATVTRHDLISTGPLRGISFPAVESFRN